MKFLLMLSVFFISVASQAFSLSIDEEKKILRLLKKYCQKVWCNGDYKYKFRTFKCKENRHETTRCTLNMKVEKHHVKGFTADQAKYLTVAAVKDSYPARCAFTNKDKTQVAPKDDELAKDFYIEVGKCIGAVEEVLDKK